MFPKRFTLEFILEAALFVLRNNYFIFDDDCRRQEIGTAMGTVFAPPYACLTIGYLEETKLFKTVLPSYFNKNDCILILQLFFRYIDDGFIIWPTRLDRSIFGQAMNSLHPNIKFTIENSTTEKVGDKIVQKLNFLDVTVILHESGQVETDIFYKETNSHDYLDYDSHHPNHTKKNIVYNLAKRIIIFVSNPSMEEKRLNELKNWLLSCNYPVKVINRGFHNAKLQGPAPDPKLKNNTIPFITTHTSNLDSSKTVKLCNELLKNTKDDNLRRIFEKSNVVLALKQPQNLLMQLSTAKFTSSCVTKKENGLFKCKDTRCLICKRYLQECTSFITSNNHEWFIRSHITCNSKFVIYYLKCICCNVTTYSGKTNNLRKRTNVHISSCRTGNSSDKFDIHVYNCRQRHNITSEPYFKLYVFVEVFKQNLLLTYESYIHQRHFDTMN